MLLAAHNFHIDLYQLLVTQQIDYSVLCYHLEYYY